MRNNISEEKIMAFKRENFTSVNAQLYGKELINEWKYVTSDDVPTRASADYFGDVQKSLYPNDMVYVSWFPLTRGMIPITNEKGHSAQGCPMMEVGMWQCCRSLT
jgi:hypothetical protein